MHESSSGRVYHVVLGGFREVQSKSRGEVWEVNHGLDGLVGKITRVEVWLVREVGEIAEVPQGEVEDVGEAIHVEVGLVRKIRQAAHGEGVEVGDATRTEGEEGRQSSGYQEVQKPLHLMRNRYHPG